MGYRLGLNFVGLMTTGVILLMMYLFVWDVFQIRDTDQPQDCICICSDESMRSTRLTSAVEYWGTSHNGSCRCEDFLVPRMFEFWTFGTANTTCQICKCKEITKMDCVDGKVSLPAIFLIVSLTLLFITALMWCDIGIRVFKHQRRAKRRRRNYVHIRRDPLERVFNYLVEKEAKEKGKQKLLDKTGGFKPYQTFNV